MNKEEIEFKNNIKKTLADFLGIDTDDIEDDFSLTEDLHMKASDLTDFLQVLSQKGYLIENLDLTEMETFSDFVEEISLHQ